MLHDRLHSPQSNNDDDYVARFSRNSHILPFGEAKHFRSSYDNKALNLAEENVDLEIIHKKLKTKGEERKQTV